MKRIGSWAIICAGLIFGGLAAGFPLPVNQRPAGAADNGRSNDDGLDPVARLQRQVEAGMVKLEYAEPGGWLQSVLQHLQVPVSSQGLVFSKTSLQSNHISPANPRAIYFNDEVYVGWIRGAELLEISVVDPKLGAAFYTIEQKPSAHPQFVSNHRCMQCHGNGNTRFVAGHLTRSVFADAEGRVNGELGSFVTDHASPFGQRWGGWYVTGTRGAERHLGNTFFQNHDLPEFQAQLTGNLTRLAPVVDLRGYASPHSDIVALMVLAHQTQMQNLFTWLNYETRMALHEQAERDRAAGRARGQWDASTRARVDYAVNETLKYLLFTDEAKLQASVAGTSGFAAEFAARGERDSQGRSLRDFDLRRRLFRYPCSYLIYSAAFDHLPQPALDELYRKLWQVLSGQAPAGAFAVLTESDRRAVLEILRETKPNLPDYFRASQSRKGW